MLIKKFCLFALTILLLSALAGDLFAYYWPPHHIPPGPPPNYHPIDTLYFFGAPPLPYPPPDSGGIYIWYDQGAWNIANHIFSGGKSYEQFHCCVLVCMSETPALGVNVFTEEFELWSDTTDKECLKQNDRWGWKQWGDQFYEIWWDVTTRDWKEGEGDPNDFMKMTIVGAAVDFNLWSSGHNGAINADKVLLGVSKTPLSRLGFVDFFYGVSDPYQDQAGSNPIADPNITIFTKYSDALRSYNKNGLIHLSDNYTCELAENYGQRYAGTFAYEGNGLQFSTNGVCQENNPPDIQLTPEDTSIFLCVDDSFCIDIFAWDPDSQDSITVEKIFGMGTYTPVTDITPIIDKHCFFPDTSGSYMFIFKVTDNGGLFDIDTSIVHVDINNPPDLILPVDTTYHFCTPENICRTGISATDVDISDTLTIEKVSGPGVYNPLTGEVCFLPADVDSTYKFVFSVIDSCGEMDTDSFYVTVDLSQAPVIISPDTVEYNLCDTSTVCFDITLYDPDDGLSVSVNPPGQYNPSDSSICFFTYKDTTYNFIIITTDACGMSDTTYTAAVIKANNPPVLIVPDDVDTFLCVPETLCFEVQATDPDSGDAITIQMISGPGIYNPLTGEICFLPADLDSNYKFVFVATDSCGETDEDSFFVGVDINEPPVVSIIEEEISELSVSEGVTQVLTYNLCDTATICFDLSLYDPEGNITEVLVNPPAQFNPSDSSVCFFADRDSTYEFSIICKDTCGMCDTAFVTVVVILNDPPIIVTAPTDLAFYLCDTSTVCFEIEVTDPDDFVADVWVNFPGQFNPSDSSICFFADRDTTYQFTIIATDTCGKSDTAYTQATVNLNVSPQVTAPDTVIYNLTDTATVCFNVNLYDPNDSLGVSVNAPGQFDPTDSSVCFFADRDTTYQFIIIATDSCGESDTAYTTAVVNFGTPPEITAPDTVKYNLCDTATVCFDITLYDPDDGLSVWVNLPGQYNPSDSSICFFADRDTTYNFTIIATDTSGLSDTAYTTAVVKLNDPPVLSAPDTVEYNLCDTATVCFDITLYDPDNGLDVWVSSPGVFNPDDSSVCFLADKDTIYDFTIIVTDTCDKSDTAYTTALLSINNPPVITAPDTVKYDLCDTNTVCFDITLNDPDDGLEVWVNPPGEFNPPDTSICFLADRDTTYHFTIIVTDSCGKADTAYTVAVIDLNYPPQLTVPVDRDTSLCDIRTICISGIVATDPDPDDTLTLEKIKGPGVFNPVIGVSPLNAQVCFTPAGVDSSYEFTFRVTNHCGAFDEKSFKVTVDMNEPPTVTAQTSKDTVELCPDALYPLNVVGDDPNADYDISLYMKEGPGSFVPVTGKPPLSGLYTWTPTAADTIQIHRLIFEVVDHCGAIDQDTLWIRVRKPHECECLIDVYIDTVDCVSPGEVVEVSVNVFSDLEIGGFKLYIEYDPGVMTFLDVERGDLIDDFDGYWDEYEHVPRYFFQYFQHRMLPCGQQCEAYKIKIMGIADMPDGWINGPLPPGQGELLKLKFKVSYDANLLGLLLPVKFEFDYDFDSLSNSFSSSSGESLYVDLKWPGQTSFPNHNILRWACFTNGGVKICSDAYCWTGDLNLNEYPYEIADAVLYSNFFIYGDQVFDIDYNIQLLASDVNEDGFYPSIADFVFLVRIILEDISPKHKLAPSTEVVDVTLTTRDDMVKVISSSSTNIGACLYVFKHSGDVKKLTLHTDMDVKYHDANGELRVLVYSFEGKNIPAGEVDLFSFQAKEVELVETKAADSYGSALKSTISTKILPTSFALMNNYPNPFNLSTSINFALPEDCQVSLKLYNISGQLVKSFEGEYQAGTHNIIWDGTNNRGQEVASGIYFYRLVAGNYTCTKKMVLMK